MAKKLDELYAPKSAGEKAFADKHKVKITTSPKDIEKTLDVQFKATNVKTFNRSANRFGYNKGEDEKAYGVGAGDTGVNDQRKPPEGSTQYPTGKFAEDMEVDALDDDVLYELSGKTLKSYVKKAGGTGNRSGWGIAKKGEKEEDKGMSTDGYKYPEKQARHQAAASKLYHKSNNRDKGVEKAKARLKKEDFALEDIDALLIIIEQLIEDDKPAPKKPTWSSDTPSPGKYNKDSVANAIKNNRTGKIGGREAKAIHALLKGRH